MKAKIESTHDDGSAQTLRDEYGGLWRVVCDPADGTLAVEEIEEFGSGPAVPAIDEAATTGMTPCGVATWNLDDSLNIDRVSSHGENHTDGSEYDSGAELAHATPSGWEFEA